MALTTIDPALQNTQAQYTGFKNRIINGAMQIAQRGTSSSAGGYSCLDRWVFNTLGTAPTASQQTATVNGITANVMQIAGIAGNTAQNVQQKIESRNCYDLVGQNVSVSFWVYQTTGSAYNLPTALLYATAVDNFTSTTSISTNTTSIPNATWTYVSFVFSSLPSGAANGLALQFFASSAALTSGVFQFAFVQLEKGSTATSFDYRPYGTELALCQRYYQTFGAGGSGGVDTTVSVNLGYRLVVPMRAAPTLSITNSSVTIRSNNVTPTSSGSTSLASYIDTGGFCIDINGFSGLTVNAGAVVLNTTWLSGSAEL